MRQSIFLAAVVLAACSGEKTKEAEAPAAPALDAPFNRDIDVGELMVHGMDPAARAFWAGWGEVYDEKGSHDVSAKSEAEWKRVEDGAAMVVLATNNLMLPPYRREPQADWIKWAKETADIAMEGKAAAENQDKAAMEAIGGRLDVACDACHKAFRKAD